MKIKTRRAYGRVEQRPTLMSGRRRSPLRSPAAAPEPRMYSLLLPPRYSTDRH
jgi:hypothetical protein